MTTKGDRIIIFTKTIHLHSIIKKVVCFWLLGHRTVNASSVTHSDYIVKRSMGLWKWCLYFFLLYIRSVCLSNREKLDAIVDISPKRNQERCISLTERTNCIKNVFTPQAHKSLQYIFREKLERKRKRINEGIKERIPKNPIWTEAGF